MSSYIYTGPRQTISVKTARAKDGKPASFKDVELAPNQPLTLDPQSGLFASLKAAGFVEEVKGAKERAAPSQPRPTTTSEDKE